MTFFDYHTLFRRSSLKPPPPPLPPSTLMKNQNNCQKVMQKSYDKQHNNVTNIIASSSIHHQKSSPSFIRPFLKYIYWCLIIYTRQVNSLQHQINREAIYYNSCSAWQYVYCKFDHPRQTQYRKKTYGQTGNSNCIIKCSTSKILIVRWRRLIYAMPAA